MVDLDLINNTKNSDKFLFLDGYGVDLRVNDGKLVIKNGDGSKHTFFPKRFPFDNIIIYGTRGSISFEAVRWITKHNAQISFINWDGQLLTGVLPPEARQTKLKFAQYRAYEDSKKRAIAKKLLEAKFQRTKDVLGWLKERYPKVDIDIDREVSKLGTTDNIKDMLAIEGRVAHIYWQQIIKIIPKKFKFESRQYTNRPFGSVDPINTLLNYGYALLEAGCRKAINSVGLDTHVGFLHEVTVGKEPLVYDLQEPFRWIVDVAVIKALENNVFEKNDFIRTGNYNLKLRTSGAKKLTKELENQFNEFVSYRGKNRRWSYVILLKTRELAKYIAGENKGLDFVRPNVELERVDNNKIREKILSMSYAEAGRLGIGKSTLWYLKRNVKADKSFKIYKKIKNIIDIEVHETEN